MRFLRRAYRIPALFIVGIYHMFNVLPASFGKDDIKTSRRTAIETRSWGRHILRVMGVKLIVHGDMSDYEQHGGLVISNHMGYLDVFVHAACFGLRFTPKKEVKAWPILGWYTGLSRPIWIDRESRNRSDNTLDLFRDTLRNKIPLIFYPEGTSTNGEDGILPFKPTLFQTIVNTEIPVQPVLTFYRVAPGDSDVCWYDDSSLMPHLWAMLGNRETIAHVYILPLFRSEGRNRKEIAALLHESMLAEYKLRHAELRGA